MSYKFRRVNQSVAECIRRGYSSRYAAILWRKHFFLKHPDRGYHGADRFRDTYVVPCPACGYPMHPHPQSDLSCFVCHWEYDRCDDPDADICGWGPNDSTLTQARRNFAVTLSVWSYAERVEFRPALQLMLFHPIMMVQQKKLCRLLDKLMRLRNPAAITAKWQIIFAFLEIRSNTQNELCSKHGITR